MRTVLLALTVLCGSAAAETTVQYIANAGVLVSDGKSKILFDPLFDNDYGQYYLPPEEVRAAILDGVPPFDNVDAVLISHAHADHFVSRDLLVLLRQHPALRLYGPDQVSEALAREADSNYAEVFDRVIAVSLKNTDPPLTIEQGELTIDAAAVPHSGWPDSMSEVQNIAFRVVLADGATVLHFGDADADDEHYAPRAEYWSARQADLAMPPYWYFLSSAGRRILEQRLMPHLAIGVHVPKNVPSDPLQRDARLNDVDLFTHPGETRRLQSP